jgi:hypothetical protein
MEEKKRTGLLDFLFVETPLIVSVAIPILIAGALFYFLVPQPPKVIYSFDAQKFKDDLVARAGLSNVDSQTIKQITAELRKMLNEYAKQGKTLVINRRAYLAVGLEGVQIVDITKEVENELFRKYVPIEPTEERQKLFEELLRGRSKNKDR